MFKCLFFCIKRYINDIDTYLGSFQPSKPPGLCFMYARYNITGTIQSTLVISNSKGRSEILRYIRTSTYQICRIEEKLTQLTTFNKYMCNWTLETRDILKILWKRGEIAEEQFLLFSTIFLHAVRFSCFGRDQIFTSR